MKIIITATFLLCFISCSFLSSKKKTFDIGPPNKTFDLDISGDHLYDCINLSITSDSCKNLIRQLGEYKFSTSRDEYFPYATTGMLLYYEFEGVRLVFDGPDAGSNDPEKIKDLIKTYPNGFRIQEIDIEPALFKGALPKTITQNDSPWIVEKKLGKYNTHFGSNIDRSEKVSFTYPNHGLVVKFNFYPEEFNADSSIHLVVITDSITEMKRWPTIFPAYAEKN